MRENELMTGKEVAEVFLVDPKTVTRWSDLGLIKSMRTPGGHRRYYRTDIEARVAEEENGNGGEEA